MACAAIDLEACGGTSITTAPAQPLSGACCIKALSETASRSEYLLLLLCSVIRLLAVCCDSRRVMLCKFSLSESVQTGVAAGVAVGGAAGLTAGVTPGGAALLVIRLDSR